MDQVTPALHRILDRIYLACQLVAAGLLVAFIVGSLVFTGGQVIADGDQLYDEVWTWPVFPVPAWLVIIPAAVAALVVIPLVVTTKVSDAGSLIGRWGQTIVGVGAGVFFAVAFAETSGTIPIPGRTGLYAGAHWIAAALFGFCFVVVLVGMAVKLPAEARLRRAGKLPGDLGWSPGEQDARARRLPHHDAARVGSLSRRRPGQARADLGCVGPHEGAGSSRPRRADAAAHRIAMAQARREQGLGGLSAGQARRRSDDAGVDRGQATRRGSRPRLRGIGARDGERPRRADQNADRTHPPLDYRDPRRGRDE